MTSSGEVGDCNQLSTPRPPAKNTKDVKEKSQPLVCPIWADLEIKYSLQDENIIMNFIFLSCKTRQDKTRLALITHTIIF